MSVAGYSRIVRFLRISLPLLAILLMSTIFLVGNDPEMDEFSEVFADIAEGELMRQGVEGPRFSGLNREGEPFVIRALSAEAISQDGHNFQIDGLSVEADTAGGLSGEMSAPSGVYDLRSETLTADGGVSALRSDGVVFSAEHAVFAFHTGKGLFSGGVVASWADGSLKASWMEIDTVEVAGSDRLKEVVTFGGGVHLVLRPSVQMSDEEPQ
ncbi:MAG: hypothetical protein AAFQ36_01455 [Pseudomonadota bacterium]